MRCLSSNRIETVAMPNASSSEAYPPCCHVVVRGSAASEWERSREETRLVGSRSTSNAMPVTSNRTDTTDPTDSTTQNPKTGLHACKTQVQSPQLPVMESAPTTPPPALWSRCGQTTVAKACKARKGRHSAPADAHEDHTIICMHSLDTPCTDTVSLTTAHNALA